MAENPTLPDPRPGLIRPTRVRRDSRRGVLTFEAQRRAARRQAIYEAVSGASGAALAFFMWGHMLLVGSILTGSRGFDWVASGLEHIYVAQPTVVIISVLFFVHAALASRKIPSQLRERRRMRDLARSLARPLDAPPGAASRATPHLESSLWIWQVRTGMVVLVFGAAHLLLIGIDLFTPMFGERVGIEAASSSERVAEGLVIPYAILLLAVEFHASVGLYRLAVKWGVGSRLSRRTLLAIERVILFGFLGFGAITLVVLAGWVDPPLAFLTEGL